MGPAPTLVLNTTRAGAGYQIGNSAWMLHGRAGRVALIPGGMLHGVLPSAGALKLKAAGDVIPPLRLSINVAWWSHPCQQKPTEGLGKIIKQVPPADDSFGQALASLPEEPV